MSASATAISNGGAAVHHTAEGTSATHRTNEWLAMILFLVSEAIIFGAIFAQYFYSRSQQANWPPGDIHRVPAVPLALILTVILAISGFTAHFAQTAIRRNDKDRTSAWLAVTIFLGVVFLAGQAYEYFSLMSGIGVFGEEGHAPFLPSSGIYGSVFYTLTGLHGLHVTGGVVALIVVLARTLMGHFTSRNHFGLEGSILYWHFVDIVWFLLYATVYII